MNGNEDEVVQYYNKTESRLGYRLLLGGTKHFGYYREDDNPWDFEAAMRRMEALLVQKLAVRPGARVLDAGCGMGDVASYVCRQADATVHGIDLLDFNLAMAAERAAKRGQQAQLKFTRMSYADLRFPDCHFDAVYTMETLVHAADSAKVLAEFFRVLRPGGRLVMFEYEKTPDDELSPQARRAYEFVNRVSAMPSFQRFLPGVLERELGEAGFQDLEVEDITAKMLPMLRAFSILGRVPYSIGKIIKKPHKVVNAMSAVEFWRHQDGFRYKVYVAKRP